MEVCFSVNMSRLYVGLGWNLNSWMAVKFLVQAC